MSSSKSSTPKGSPDKSSVSVDKASPISAIAPIIDDPKDLVHDVEAIEPSPAERASYQPIDLIRVVIPVMACMIFVILMTVLTTKPQQAKPFNALTPFNSKDADFKTTAWQTAANVAILITVVVVLTFVLLALYYCYCYKVLYVIMAIPVIVVNLVFTWIYLHKVFDALNIPIDHITAAVLTLNFGAVGIISILGKAPKILQQIYLLYLCGVMAIIYVTFMPDWTVWLFLGALAIWDLIAVLTPCGPLRILVETIQSREHDFVPAMVYTTAVYTMAKKEGGGKEKKPKAKGKPKKKKPKQTTDDAEADEEKISGEGGKKEKRRLRLGLGDFVFYSLLTGKATERCISQQEYVDWSILMACFVAIITGLLFTVILLVLYKKALPALPISIAFGLAFYFGSINCMSPFMDSLNWYQMFI